MIDDQDSPASERKEIAARVATFKATQAKFQREREEYFATTMENARHSENTRTAQFERPLLS
jgi:chorismate mutase